MGLFDSLLMHGTIDAIEPIARRMRCVRIRGEALKHVRPHPGQQVRVVVGELLGLDLLRREALRTYSIWRHDAEAGWLELCVLDHPNAGPGAKWAREASVGDAVRFLRPEGRFTLRAADTHVFVGEETASVAAGAMMRALGPRQKAIGLFDVDSPADALPMPSHASIAWLNRDGEPAEKSTRLLAAARGLQFGGDERVAVYLAGEAGTIKAMRRELLARKRANTQFSLKPFWSPGAKGLD